MTECIPILKITDGTTIIDLLSTSGGILLNDWTPALAEIKEGGVFVDNPVLHGRRITARNRTNPIDVFDVKVFGQSQDAVIFTTQKIRRLLGKAVDYWITDFQNEPVWIEARGPNETNIRYAVIVDWRMESDDNPYSTPFFNSRGHAAMDEISIALEHLEWTDVAPGDYSCVEVSAGQNTEGYVTRSYTDTQTDDDVSVNHTDTTVDLSAITQTFGNNSSSKIMGGGIRFRSVTIPNGANIIGAYIAFVSTALRNAVSCNAVIKGELSATPAVFTTYANYAARTRTAASVEWTEVEPWSGGVTYFSPNIKDVIQEIVDLGGWASGNNLVLFVRDSQTNPSKDGSYRDYASWDSTGYDAPILYISYEADSTFYGITATCEEETYISNDHTLAAITHIYVYDDAPGGTYTSILGTTLPQTLLPGNPDVNDAIYFGITSGAPNSGPFTNLVFDIGTATADITGYVFEYYNGAWTTLQTQESNTIIGFTVTGVNAVVWEAPTDWTTVTINGVNAYWVRFRVTAVGGSSSPPTQQNRDIYTCIWPYVEIDSTKVGGDLTALARTTIRNQSKKGGLFGPYITGGNFMVGIRSLSRGINFTPFINLGNTQNPSGAIIGYGADTASYAYIASPTGYVARYNPSGVDAMGARAIINFYPEIAVEYQGYYRVFLRHKQVGGSAGDFSVRFVFSNTYGNYSITGSTINLDTGPGAVSVADLGALNIQFAKVLPSEGLGSLASFYVQASNSSGTPGDLYMYEIILFPVDEWGGQFDNTLFTTTTMEFDDYLDVDSILFPKHRIRSLARHGGANEGQIYMLAQMVAPGSFILQANATQRLWFFDLTNYFELVSVVKVQKAQRYHSMRGFN